MAAGRAVCGLAFDPSWLRERTVRIQELKRTLFRDAVETVVEIGEALTEVKARLRHGVWADWLTNQVHFDQRTANRYMVVAAFSRRNSTLMSKIKGLGPTKVYRLAALPAPVVRRLLGRSRHEVPGTLLQRSLAEMSAVEFTYVAHRAAGPRRRPPAPPAYVMRTVRALGTRLLGRLCSLKKDVRLPREERVWIRQLGIDILREAKKFRM